MILCVTKERTVLMEDDLYYASPHKGEKKQISEIEALTDYLSADSFNKKLIPMDRLFPKAVKRIDDGSNFVNPKEYKAEYVIVGRKISGTINVHIINDTIRITKKEDSKKQVTRRIQKPE